MSSNMFRTEADVMVATAGRVDDTNTQVQGELGRLRNTVDGIRGSWVGSAQVSFDALMQRWDTSARQLQEALDSIGGNIRSNAKNFEGVEAQNAQSFAAVGGQGLSL
ncbi:WXG domain conatining protein [Corynebacterium occultum]|uniref:ESAT-6-like protein n=1 Tax=Corynebacterium occultum TaxID=2675219 RepID=A0A6B8W1T8_9CORY|nr:WXG100 family type VII secretion target [Corynebacterium occultum]QGU06471.1 WXG domain conatining protein [Corynebacterium occultum]